MNSRVDAHYRQDDLTSRITGELVAAGLDLAQLRPDDLAGVDEFHLGGRAATEALLDDLDLTATSRVLDVGSGIGGAARTIAATAGCSVMGIDLTAEFVETATDLSAMVGLASATSFAVGNAVDLVFPDDHFDVALMLHVGMNIADKGAAMAELARVVRPGGHVAVYDIMRVAPGELTYPVPWASGPETSFVASAADYRDAMATAGLEPGEPANRLDIVQRGLEAASLHPPAVNLSHLMGADWPTMFGNLRLALESGMLAPTQIVARQRAT